MTPDETDQYDLTDDNKGQRTIAVRAWENYRRDLNITLSLPNIPSGGRGGDDRVMIQDFDQIGLAVLDVSARYFSPTGGAGGRDHIVSAMHRDIAL